jgi:hypothetical protein
MIGEEEVVVVAVWKVATHPSTLARKLFLLVSQS